MLDAIVSAWPRSSAPTPGKAPGVSMKVKSGFCHRSASSISLIDFLYPSGLAMPKFLAAISLRVLPFWCPTTATLTPLNRAKPVTTAGSSLNLRSPWISIKSVHRFWI